MSFLINYEKFIPDQYVKTIYDIDFTKLYEKGIRLILTDLDNTLISYRETDPKDETYGFLEKLKRLGFEVILVSNSKKKRVKHYADLLHLKYVFYATKPLLRGYKKALKLTNKTYEKTQVLTIGDQLLTDVYGSRKSEWMTILVKAIDRKTERFVTRVNRFFENIILKRIKKHHLIKYDEILKEYKEDQNECL